MGRAKHYDGVRARSNGSIEIDFYYRGIRCRESFKIAPTPANLKKVAQHRAAILDAIARGVFDYAVTFPNSKTRFKFAEMPQSAGLRLEEYLDQWVDNKKKEIKASTLAGYKKIVAVLNKSDLINIYLPDLKRSHIKEWCRAQNATNKWLTNVQSCLRTALNDAVDDDLLESNPLYGWTYKNAEALKTEDDIDPFTIQEREAILNACNDPQFRNMFEFAFWTGMRTSEYIALKWDDIDFIKGIARVNKAKTQPSKVVETTKTKKGIRDIKLLPPALEVLKKQKAMTYLQGGVIFRNPRTGNPWEGDAAIRCGPWKSALKLAGVRYRWPYQTRHTYASMMLTAEEPLGWVADQLGHSDLVMLARVYARWIPSARKDTGEKAVLLFSKDKSCDQICDQAGSNSDISRSQNGHKEIANH